MRAFLVLVALVVLAACSAAQSVQRWQGRLSWSNLYNGDRTVVVCIPERFVLVRLPTKVTEDKNGKKQEDKECIFLLAQGRRMKIPVTRGQPVWGTIVKIGSYSSFTKMVELQVQLDSELPQQQEFWHKEPIVILPDKKSSGKTNRNGVRT